MTRLTGDQPLIPAQRTALHDRLEQGRQQRDRAETYRAAAQRGDIAVLVAPYHGPTQ